MANSPYVQSLPKIPSKKVIATLHGNATQGGQLKDVIRKIGLDGGKLSSHNMESPSIIINPASPQHFYSSPSMIDPS